MAFGTGLHVTYLAFVAPLVSYNGFTWRSGIVNFLRSAKLVEGDAYSFQSVTD